VKGIRREQERETSINLGGQCILIARMDVGGRDHKLPGAATREKVIAHPKKNKMKKILRQNKDEGTKYKGIEGPFCRGFSKKKRGGKDSGHLLIRRICRRGTLVLSE